MHFDTLMKSNRIALTNILYGRMFAATMACYTQTSSHDAQAITSDKVHAHSK